MTPTEEITLLKQQIADRDDQIVRIEKAWNEYDVKRETELLGRISELEQANRNAMAALEASDARQAAMSETVSNAALDLCHVCEKIDSVASAGAFQGIHATIDKLESALAPDAGGKWRAKLAQVEADAAAMREALQLAAEMPTNQSAPNYVLDAVLSATDALKSTAGQSLLAERDALRETARRRLGLLKKLEWGSRGDGCVFCGHARHMKHANDCALAKELATMDQKQHPFAAELSAGKEGK